MKVGLKVKQIFWQIGRAVQDLHRQGISHNDIKPDNVVLTADGNAKLIDFGFAKIEPIVGPDDKSGTLQYAAPELFGPCPFRPQKADIWSLGTLLFTMSTGRFAFPNDSVSVTIEAIRQGKVAYPAWMNPDVEDLVRRLTNVDARERPTIDAGRERSLANSEQAK
jgi:serine/threonine protein kinase